MTPKEKAKELIEKYYFTEISFHYFDSKDGRCIQTETMFLSSAIKCALFAIEEILQALQSPPIKNENSKLWLSSIDYYNQVKILIENYKDERNK